MGRTLTTFYPNRQVQPHCRFIQVNALHVTQPMCACLTADGGATRTGRRKSELSIAAHAELLAAQLLDDSAGAVVIDANISTLAGSGNTWQSTNTSSSSQTQVTQRLTRLDTAAWQIDYSELKFSRVIGEGSFG